MGNEKRGRGEEGRKAAYVPERKRNTITSACGKRTFAP